MPLLGENTGIISDNCGYSHAEGSEVRRKHSRLKGMSEKLSADNIRGYLLWSTQAALEDSFMSMSLGAQGWIIPETLG